MLFNFELDTIPLSVYIIELLIYTFVCYNTITYIRRCKVYKDKKKYRAIVFLLFFVLISVVYCVNHDYFEYRRFCEDLDHILIYYDKEIIYATLADAVGRNYELFRLIIWGGGLLLFYLSLKFTNTKVYISLLLLFSLFVNIYCYARASLAMSIFLIGLVLVVHDKGPKILKILGVFLLLSSVIFHRSMIVAIICMPFLYVDFSNIKKTLLISIFVVGLSVLLVPVLNLSFLGDDYTNSIEGYRKNIEQGMWESRSFVNYVQKLWSYSIFYIPIFIIANAISKFRKNVCTPIYRIFKVNIGIIIIATVFMFVFGFGNPFFYRTLYMSMLPIVLLLAYCYSNRLIGYKPLAFLIFWSWSYHVIYMLVNLQNLGFV